MANTLSAREGVFDAFCDIVVWRKQYSSGAGHGSWFDLCVRCGFPPESVDEMTAGKAFLASALCEKYVCDI
jgi:hypothetical protein